jgi:hypothetical protein
LKAHCLQALPTPIVALEVIYASKMGDWHHGQLEPGVEFASKAVVMIIIDQMAVCDWHGSKLVGVSGLNLHLPCALAVFTVSPCSRLLLGALGK